MATGKLTTCIFPVLVMLSMLLQSSSAIPARSNRPSLRETGNSININTDLRFRNKPGQCIALPFNQTVTKRGCLPVKIPNNMCFGTCSSMYIPHGDPLETYPSIKDTFFDCRHCIPDKYQLIRVPMFCPGRKRKHRTKKVLLVHSCSCVSRKCVIQKKR